MRMLFLGLLLLVAAMAPNLASAQNTTGLVVETCGTVPTAFKAGNPGPFTVDVNGNMCGAGGGGGGPADVNVAQVNGAPPSGTNPLWVAPASSTAFPILAAPRSALTIAGCTVGAASAECIPASTANFWIQVQNTHATNQIACSWGGTSALNSSGSFMLQPGQSASWGAMTSGVPTNALNCIASGASTPLYVEIR